MHGEGAGVVADAADDEISLRHSQKMEAVGQLASGIAHEINTPIQFVGDSVFFLQSAFDDLIAVVKAARVELGRNPTVDQLCDDIDLEYLLEEVPRAFERTRGGCDRVSTIVQAMRHFASPDSETPQPADLATALETTLVVAANTIKRSADVETQLPAMPPVVCHVGDLNQVFLNLLVNAAHAIDDADRGRGRITVTGRVDEPWVEIRITDTGCGIPEAVASRIFEPFFTTKEVGRGTGQGLALCHAVVVERHRGTLTFETGDQGTTFVVRLPIRGPGAPKGR
ncbi:MAG: HAMP domain-containing sensor histidine kinase [Myxococcota bacterium]